MILSVEMCVTCSCRLQAGAYILPALDVYIALIPIDDSSFDLNPFRQ